MTRSENRAAARGLQGPAACGGWGKGLLAITALSAAVLAGCGGGGGGGGDDPATPQTSSVGVRVIDGAIGNALVCLDVNTNGSCDSGEPSARTDAEGNAKLEVAAADAGKYPVLAVVGTDAVDEDHGAVTVPFVMKAPADQPAVVSPITTLVQTTVETTGVSSTQAATNLQSQLGLNVSLFSDFTADDTTEGQTLGTIARMVVVTQQQQSTALTSTVGTTAIDGSTISQSDLNALIARKLVEILPSLVAAVADPAVQAAIASGDPAQVNAALAPLATAIVADPVTGISTNAVATLVGAANQAASGANDTPATTPGATLANLTWFGSNTWFRRLLVTSAADAVIDGNGNGRFHDNRLRNNNGAIAAWGAGGDPERQSDIHWNGTAWAQCGLQFGSTATPRDAQGRSSYNYCDGVELGNSSRAAFDIAGRTLLDVYNQVREAGYTNISIDNAATALGSATFPAGSKVFYHTSSPASTAVAYQPRMSQVTRVYNSDALAAGDSTLCSAVSTTAPLDSYSMEAMSLQQLVARAAGVPCTYSQGSITNSTTGVSYQSGPRNEYWGMAAVSIGQIGTAPTLGGSATSYYTTNTLLRVAFGPNGTAKYYSCQQRANDGSPRNCDLVGTGTYSTGTLGDAKTLALQNVPPQFGSLTYERVFVERAGKVYYGFKSKPITTNVARFNLEAANGFFAQLGIPVASADDTVTLTPTSYQGDWIFWGASNGTDGYLGDATIIRFPAGFNGSAGAQCFDAVSGNPGTGFTCNVTLDAAGALSFTDTRDGAMASATLDMVAGTASGTSTDTSGTAPILGRRR